jgi:polyisoprenyl-phosphate glycosyltransferase
VLGVRSNRREADGWLVRTLAHAYYSLAGWLRTPTVPQHGDFRLMSRELVAIVNALPERNRFLRTIIPQLDSRYATISYSRRPRRRGRSKHGVVTVLAIAMDGIVGFGFQPLRLASVLGAGLMLAAVLGLLACAVLALAGAGVGWQWWLLLAIVLLAAVQLLFLGIIGEYLGRVFIETRGRPFFLVREKLEHPAAPAAYSTTANDR